MEPDVKLPVDLNGESPLHFAVRDDNSKEVEELLEVEKDPNRASNKNITPFHLVKSLEIVDLFLKKYQGVIPWKKDDQNNHVFQNLLKKDDRLAKRVLDHFIGTNFSGALDDEHLIVHFDLKAFQDHEHKTKEFIMEYHKFMDKSGSDLIYHPISIMMAELKWACKSKLVRYLYPFAQLIFTACLTWMSFCVFDKAQEKEELNLTGKFDMLTTCHLDLQNVTKQPDCSMALIYKNTTSNDSTVNDDSAASHCRTPALFSLIFLHSLLQFHLGSKMPKCKAHDKIQEH